MVAITERAGICPTPGCKRFLKDHTLPELRGCMSVIAEADNVLRGRACGGATWAATDRMWRARRRIEGAR